MKLQLGDAIPDRLAYELEALRQLQHGAFGVDSTILAAIAEHEFHRMLGKKRGQHGATPLTVDTRER